MKVEKKGRKTTWTVEKKEKSLDKGKDKKEAGKTAATEEVENVGIQK